MHKSEFEELAEIRLKEAKVLCRDGNYDGAYYLAGYSIECALKACIAERTRPEEFPPNPKIVSDCYTHDLGKLAKRAEIEQQLKLQTGADKTFAQNWNVVKGWSEQSRYERHNKVSAEELIEAIEDSSNGILPWLRSFW